MNKDKVYPDSLVGRLQQFHGTKLQDTVKRREELMRAEAELREELREAQSRLNRIINERIAITTQLLKRV